MTNRVIALWLDGFDMNLADSYGLPNLARLQNKGSVATLDHGTAHLTGLTGEHLATGLDPLVAERASGIRFDPITYQCVKEGTLYQPIFTGDRTVVFDMTYFDLESTTEEVIGVTDWGGHDPGGSPQARPESLRAELEDRFGMYPARKWIYGVPWASGESCTEMGRALTQAVNVRSRITTWLLSERFTDWRLALIGFSESHSASEGLYHGADQTHPWANLASTERAGEALYSVYSAIDEAVGEITDAFPDDTVVLFSMHGMGSNSGDVPSMALLGEILARWCELELESATSFTLDRNGIPKLHPDSDWATVVLQSLTGQRKSQSEVFLQYVKKRLPRRFRDFVRKMRQHSADNKTHDDSSLMWMPLMRHQNQWPEMKAFALPSFSDGRIRINLQGRESSGCVNVSDFDTTIKEIESLLQSCVEIRTGRPVVKYFERVEGDPLQRRDHDVDVVVHWADDVLGIHHPKLGSFGPLPPRRTGGHSSSIGRLVIVGPDIAPQELGIRSSFDVIPTVLDLVGATEPISMSGEPLKVRTQ